MPVWRLQSSVWMDTVFPTDAMVITPHFDDRGVGTDPDGLCEDMADALLTYYGAGKQIVVKAYDAQGTPPVFPQGEAVRNLGQAQASGMNRDVAICLSFYAEHNRPRHRGRLYIPCAAVGISPQGARPNATGQQRAADLVPILAGLGGVDVDWVVYSRVDNQARKVTNWWVDNTWDTQRSRGPRPTSRLAGTTSG